MARRRWDREYVLREQMYYWRWLPTGGWRRVRGYVRLHWAWIMWTRQERGWRVVVVNEWRAMRMSRDERRRRYWR